MLLLANIEKQILMINDRLWIWKWSHVLHPFDNDRQRRIAPFCNGEIGRAELEGKETRLHRAAVLVSHSVDVATTQITLFCTPVYCTPWSCKPFSFL